MAVALKVRKGERQKSTSENNMSRVIHLMTSRTDLFMSEAKPDSDTNADICRTATLPQLEVQFPMLKMFTLMYSNGV